jgi:predicted RecA/RadA family phage recombinase
MAKNYIQPGDVVTVAAPTGGVASGAGVLVGSLFGIAATTAAQGAPVEIVTTGVFTLPKLSAQAWTVGARIYWDDTNKHCTTTASTHKLIGVALAVADNPSAIGVVRLSAAFTL